MTIARIEDVAALAQAFGADIGAIEPNVRKLNTESTRAPLPSDDETQGYAVGSRWLWQGQEWVFGGAGWRLASIAPYPSRSALVTAIALGLFDWLPGGAVLWAGGLGYVKMRSDHILYETNPIYDMPGWVHSGDAYPEHYGDIDGVDDNDFITAASVAVSAMGGGVVRLMAKAYVGSGRAVEAVTPGVRWIGPGAGACSYTITAYNSAIWPMSDDCALEGVTVDGGGLQTEEAGKGAIIRYANRCVVRDTVAQNGYTPYGPSGGAPDSRFYNITSKDSESRGWQADHNCHRNEVFGLTVDNCGNSVIRIGYNASGNKIFGVYGVNHNSNTGAAVWFAQGAHDNLVDGIVLEAPAGATAPAFQFEAHSFRNTVCNFKVEGHSRLVQFIGSETDGAFPGDVSEGNTELNVVKDGTAVGVTTTPAGGTEGYYYGVTFLSDGTYAARENTVQNVSFNAFYGVFRNGDGAGSNTGCDGANLRDIRTTNIGAGGVMSAMKDATDRVHLSNIDGFPTSAQVSGSIAVDSAGLKTATINHGLPWTPTDADCTVRLLRGTVVADYRFDTMHIAAAPGTTSVTARCNISTASATGGATAFLSVSIDHRDDVTFPLARIT